MVGAEGFEPPTLWSQRIDSEIVAGWLDLHSLVSSLT